METYVKIKAYRDSHDIRDVKAITIAELIEDLKSYPMDAKIAISFDQGYTFGSISYDNMYQCQVETFEEQAERERKEREEEENTIWVCPNCGTEDDIVCSVKGGMQCLECGAHFKKPIINKR